MHKHNFRGVGLSLGNYRAKLGLAAGRLRDGVLILSVLFAAGGAVAQSADSEYLTVVLSPDTTIRQIAEEYLSDPDLWPEILKSSGIGSIADLKPGMELQVPVNEISTANQALVSALAQIQKANEIGAQVFAPDNIVRAVTLHDLAKEKRLERAWGEIRGIAETAYAEATAAIAIAEAKRDQKGEALVSDRNGEVEGQRPEDLSWRDLELKAVLVEEEKVRTLSDSTAQITFRDASRLRLNANSNAVIKVMRFDPLSNTEEAQVSLVEGDFYALLAAGGGNSRNKFNVDVPNVEANIQSANFWVANDGRNAKFANYDEGSVSVAAAGETVTLGRNEGTLVEQGARPTDAVSLLPPPEPARPADESLVHLRTPEISWSTIDGAAGYWLEVAEDQKFSSVVESQFGLGEPRFVTDPLPVGDYFWRVSSLDGFGLPGERSQVFRFTIAPDETPPYLKIESPAADIFVREASVRVTGESEPGASVTIDDIAAEVDADGSFDATIEAAEGANRVVVVATDPAGNQTRRERAFTYMPDTESVVVFDDSARRVGPLHFLTNDDVVSLGGTTTPDAEIEVRADGAVRASAVTDGDGAFRLNVPLAADEERLDFAVIASSGFTTITEIAVTIDREPPAIAFDEILPRLTAEGTLRVVGRTEPDAVLTLNGREIALADGQFDETVTLAPGENTVELTATDAVGNVKVEKSVVRLDQEPPLLVSSAAAPTTNAGRQVLVVTVVAEDSSGLAKAAPFVVVTASGDHTGYLRFNKAARAYEAIVVLPQAEIADARLGRVELSDDAGNTKTFDITQDL